MTADEAFLADTTALLERTPRVCVSCSKACPRRG